MKNVFLNLVCHAPKQPINISSTFPKLNLLPSALKQFLARVSCRSTHYSSQVIGKDLRVIGIVSSVDLTTKRNKANLAGRMDDCSIGQSAVV